jgi:hypothetical protein
MQDSIAIDSLGCTLPLAEVYFNVPETGAVG